MVEANTKKNWGHLKIKERKSIMALRFDDEPSLGGIGSSCQICGDEHPGRICHEIKAMSFDRHPGKITKMWLKGGRGPKPESKEGSDVELDN